MPPFRFYLITDRLNVRHDVVDWLPRLAAAGLRALQVREKDLPPRALAEHCRALKELLPRSGAAPRLYLNDRADIALALRFTGVHLREDSLPLGEQPGMLRQRLRFGVSTHSVESVRAAFQAGAEFATFGPVFETASKAGYGAPLGLDGLQQAAKAAPLPIFALGGVTPEGVRDCLQAGASGVAAIGAVWNADDPVAALERFREALGGL
jgi:thiamine-phosphate pyrophosphorylase